MQSVDPVDPVEFLANEIGRLPPKGRQLIGISGPPASGKSTLAATLVDRLNEAGGAAVLVPMDGFHLDNNILIDRGLLDRKGAPETFDAGGLINALSRLRSEAHVIVPSFDRVRDVSVAGAIEVTENHRTIVVEGNYLCFSDAPWSQLSDIWDLSAYLNVPVAILQERLVQRWLELGKTRPEALQKAQLNDLPNAARIAISRMPTDFVIGPPR
jgi:pantothenate kinase